MVDSGGATTSWCPAGEWRVRERAKVIVDLQEKHEKVFVMILFRNDDL
jgi:hypothetical protein